MGRGGQPKDRNDGPERKCIATGEVRPASELIRFVVGPDGNIEAMYQPVRKAAGHAAKVLEDLG